MLIAGILRGNDRLKRYRFLSLFERKGFRIQEHLLHFIHPEKIHRIGNLTARNALDLHIVAIAVLIGTHITVVGLENNAALLPIAIIIHIKFAVLTAL